MGKVIVKVKVSIMENTLINKQIINKYQINLMKLQSKIKKLNYAPSNNNTSNV